MIKGERKHLELLCEQCEASSVYGCLTKNEKKKVKLWRMMATSLERNEEVFDVQNVPVHRRKTY